MDVLLNGPPEPCERYEEPQVYDLGGALTFFLGDEGDGEDSAKVLTCTRCAEEQQIR